MAAIGTPNPPHLPRLVGEVIRTDRIPDYIIRDLSYQLQVTQEYEGGVITGAALLVRSPFITL